MNSKPLILISNDDGIDARGLRHLSRIASQFGEVVVIAPDGPYSGKSHSISVAKPFLVEEKHVDGATKAYSVSGSPVDCIKVGIDGILDRRPDVVLSGINHGSNASACTHYSGTLGAAREAAMLGLPSIAFSLTDHHINADFSEVDRLCGELIPKLMNISDNRYTYYNINIPPCIPVKGVKVCRVANGYWSEKSTKFTAPFDQKFIWLEGTFVNLDIDATDTDEYFLANGYASITPMQLDATDYNKLNSLKELL